MWPNPAGVAKGGGGKVRGTNQGRDGREREAACLEYRPNSGVKRFHYPVRPGRGLTWIVAEHRNHSTDHFRPVFPPNPGEFREHPLLHDIAIDKRLYANGFDNRMIAIPPESHRDIRKSILRKRLFFPKPLCTIILEIVTLIILYVIARKVERQEARIQRGTKHTRSTKIKCATTTALPWMHDVNFSPFSRKLSPRNKGRVSFPRDPGIFFFCLTRET